MTGHTDVVPAEVIDKDEYNVRWPSGWVAASLAGTAGNGKE
jgi:hypothetical protein